MGTVHGVAKSRTRLSHFTFTFVMKVKRNNHSTQDGIDPPKCFIPFSCTVFVTVYVFGISGTTLNLLKFPICNPTPYRMFQRQKRLKRDATEAEENLSQQEQNKLNLLKKHGYLVGKCLL